MSSQKTGVSGNNVIADRLKAQIQELDQEKRSKLAEVSSFYDTAIDGLQNTLKQMGVNGVTFAAKKSTPVAQTQTEGKRRPGRPKGSKNKPHDDTEATTEAKVKRGPGRPKGSGNNTTGNNNAKTTASRKRPRNEHPLRDVVLEVLNESGSEPLYLLDITKKVKEKGYKSSAKNFGSMVYQTLQEMVSQEKSVHTEKGEDRKVKYGVVKKAA